MNVAFGFAARKASRHQLHKHVNAHVYLGVLCLPTYHQQRVCCSKACTRAHALLDGVPRSGIPRRAVGSGGCTCMLSTNSITRNVVLYSSRSIVITMISSSYVNNTMSPNIEVQRIKPEKGNMAPTKQAVHSNNPN